MDTLDFFSNPAFPIDVIIEIIVRVPPSELGNLILVSKNWRDTLRDEFIRKLQLRSWRRSNNILLNCCNKPSFDKYCRTIQVYKSPSGSEIYRDALDHEWFQSLDDYSLIGVCEGIICLKFRGNDFMERLMLCNPLIKRMRKIDLPMSLPNRCYLKVCLGYIKNPSSSHILLIYEFIDRTRAGAFVYNSLSKRWTHLGIVGFLRHVQHSNHICIDGNIYLLSQYRPISSDPNNYIICFDINNYEFTTFICPDVIQGRLCTLIVYKSMLGVIVHPISDLWGVITYWNRSVVSSEVGGVGLDMIRGKRCSVKPTQLVCFINGEFIVHDISQSLDSDVFAPVQPSTVYWIPYVPNFDEQMRNSRVDSNWGAAKIFEYHESFRTV